jgi:dihydrofolate synthase/folylpolyglutamate synthase
MVMQEPAPRKLETLTDAARYLEGLINHERRSGFDYARLDLAAIDALLEALGRPQDALSVIHVAGSKGKGSTCLFVETLLLALGESVGTFTSPHLESWVERFRVDGRFIDEARLVAAVERVRPPVEALREGPPETRPSFFDATTAVAILLFAEAGVDHAILEVGLGGRLDSTNVVAPGVTCITSIELEHTAQLGETEAAIAGEKAGILKPGVPLILGELRAEAEAVIRRRASEVGAPVRAMGEAFAVAGRIDSSATEGFPWTAQALHFEAGPDCAFIAPLAMSGRPALINAGLAVECVRALGVHSDAAIARVAASALAERRLPGRIEILMGDPRVVIDSAHTAESARALAAVLSQVAPEGYTLLLSVSADKNLGGVLDALLPGAQSVWVTRAEPLRSLPPETLAARVREHSATLPIEVVDDPEKAALRARDALPAGQRLCATGSIYLAGVAGRVLRDRITRLEGRR